MRNTTMVEMEELGYRYNGHPGNLGTTMMYFVARMDGIPPLDASNIVSDFEEMCRAEARGAGSIVEGKPYTPLLLEEFRIFAAERSIKE